MAFAFALALLVAPRTARAEGFGPEVQWTSGFCYSGNLCLVGNFDGQGGHDIALFASDGDVYVSLSRGSGFDYPARWVDGFAPPAAYPMVGDFDGDGDDDILIFSYSDIRVALSDGRGNFDIQSAPWWSSWSGLDPFVADVDGDGKDDLIQSDGGDIGFLMSTGSGFQSSSGYSYVEDSSTFRFGRVDQGPAVDLVEFRQSAGGAVAVHLSDGVQFVYDDVYQQSFAPTPQYPELADFDGDGLVDLVSFARQSTRNVYTAHGDGGSFGAAVLAHDDFCSDSDQCSVGDFDGDGKTDLIAFVTTTQGGKSAGDVFVSLRQPCGVFDSPGSSCADSLACNGTETCHTGAVCYSDTDPTDDGDACTQDVCTEGTPIQVEHNPINPDDWNACTVDWCESSSGVQHYSLPSGTPCSDGNACNGPEMCDGAGRCNSVGSFTYDDGNPCTVDACDPSGAVTHTYLGDGASCTNWDPCDGEEVCEAGVCQPGQPPTGPECKVCSIDRGGQAQWVDDAPASSPCNDGNTCTTGDACDGNGSCVGSGVASSGTSCSDSDACNGDETCNASGTCLSGTPPTVDDANPCTADSCDANAGVQHVPVARGPVAGCTGTVECDGAGRCAPVEGAPAEPVPSSLDPGIATPFVDSTEFIYAGANPIQTLSGGGSVGGIDPLRVGVIRARVLGRDSFGGAGSELPLPNVKVTVLGQAGIFGETYTRNDGWFDFAVNGGGPVTIVLEKDSYLSAQRTIEVPWHDYALLNDVVMVAPSSLTTNVQMCSGQCSGPVTVAAGDAISNPAHPEWARTGKLFVPATIGATVTWADDTVTAPPVMEVRITEYTVGSTGPQAMPAKLPPSSGYTYAIELEAIDANDVGAKDVQLSGTVPYYVENFLDFKVGVDVPSGYYDTAAGAWKASDAGRVVKVTGVDGNGYAELDIDSGLPGGDPSAETPAALQAALPGITDEERTALAQQYSVGDELWRVPLQHFTTYDFNFPSGPKPCSSGGPCADDDGGGPGPQPPPCPSQKNGSIIECEAQALGEDLPLAGTPYKLSYRSSRTSGHYGDQIVRVKLPATSDTTKSARLRFEVSLVVAGKVADHETYASNQFGQVVMLGWDGTDVHGRAVNGGVNAKVYVDEVYEANYYEGASFADFAPDLGANAQLASNGRTEAVVRREWTKTLGGYDAKGEGLGGWTLNAVHWYDPNGRVLYRGDGKRRSVEAEGDTVEQVTTITEAWHAVVGPDGAVYVSQTSSASASPGYIWRIIDGTSTLIAGSSASTCTDGAIATTCKLNHTTGLAVDAGNVVYVAEAGANKIRKLVPSGQDFLVYTVAGTGAQGSQDGDPLATATFNHPEGLAIAPDGALYIADWGSRKVRKLDPARSRVTTIAGNGGTTSPCPAATDGSIATAATLTPWGVAASPSGSIFVTAAKALYEIGTDGSIRRVAGDCSSTSPVGDGGPALDAPLNDPRGVAIAPNGSIYVADSTGIPGGNGFRIRRIDPDGTILTVAGNGDSLPTLYGGLARQTSIGSIYGLTLAPDGSLYLLRTNGEILRVLPLLPPSPPSGDMAIYSADGREKYRFDAFGRHQDTANALTGAVLTSFVRDPGTHQVTQIVEHHPGATANPIDTTTTITRNGSSIAVTAPHGQVTNLGLDGNGYLASVTYPVVSAGQTSNDTFTLEHDGNGLLTKLTDPRGYSHLFVYDEFGALVEDHDSGGGVQLLSRSFLASDLGYRVEHTDASGRVTKYDVDPSGEGITRTITRPGVNATVSITFDNRETRTTYPDGTVVVAMPGVDPLGGPQSTFVREQTTTVGSLSRHTVRSRGLAGNVWSETTTVDPGGLNATSTVSLDLSSLVRVAASAEGRVVTQVLDEAGRIKNVSRPGLADRQFDYDAEGRLISITQGVRASNLGYWSNAGNKSGYVNTVEDALGQTISLTPDALGRTIQRSFNARDTTLAWDATHNLVGVTPPGKLEHKMRFDGLHQLVSYQPPGVGSTSFTTIFQYDIDRTLKQEARPSGLQLFQRYFPLSGKLDFISSDDPSGSNPTKLLDYQYDAAGRLTSIAGPSAGVTVGFSYAGFLPTSTTWTGAVSGAVARTYDDTFRIASETITPGGINTTLAFGYDKDGLVTCVSPTTCPPDPQDQHVYAVQYGFPVLNSNTLLRQTQIGGVAGTLVENFEYNEFGELARQNVTYGGASKMDIVYESKPRDELGRVVEKNESVGSTSSVWTYSYNGDNRLFTVNRNATPFAQFLYDSNGNRTSVDGSTQIADYDAQDRVLSYGGAVYTFNEDGDLHTKTIDSATTTYGYDGFHNLRDVWLSNGDHVEYLVDGLGRRVGKKRNGTLTKQWIYDQGARPLAEFDGTGVLRSRFVYVTRGTAPDLMIRADGSVLRIISDELGSVRLVIDVDTGTIEQQVDYGPYGWPELVFGAWDVQPFGYAGGIFDVDTKLVRLGARDYDPAIGRWTARDPLVFDADSTNLYAYVDGDPINRNDPTGLEYAPPRCRAPTPQIYVCNGYKYAYDPRKYGAQCVRPPTPPGPHCPIDFIPFDFKNPFGPSPDSPTGPGDFCAPPPDERYG